jgi:hypothetical protein
MDAPWHWQTIGNILASDLERTVAIHERLMKLAAKLPLAAVEALLYFNMPDSASRRLSAELAQQPAFARNFFALGLEEVRDIPETFDVSAFPTATRALLDIQFRQLTSALLAASCKRADVRHAFHQSVLSHRDFVRPKRQMGSRVSHA